jgi:hypothetical protein
MVSVEDLTDQQRQDLAESIEREWHIHLTPDLPAIRKPQRVLVVSTSINPEPIIW